MPARPIHTTWDMRPMRWRRLGASAQHGAVSVAGWWRAFVVRRRVGWHAKLFAGPRAQVGIAAALAAEGAPRIALGIYRRFAAAGAGHGAIGRGFHRHRANSKSVSLPQLRSLPSASGRMKRTDTISRWPLISGTNPVSDAMRTRINWKVLPCGRLC